MSERGHLRLLPAPEDREKPASEAKPVIEGEVVIAAASSSPSKGRRLAPGAPFSPGTMPFELARELRVGEVAVWWNEKSEIAWTPVLIMLGAAAVIMTIASVVAPELWTQPFEELWKPLVATLLPTLLVLGREWMSRRAIAVTDGSIIELDHRGRVERLGFRNVRKVRRDLLTGGVLLEGAEHKIRIPPSLADDAREAIASQLRMGLRGSEKPDDTLGWMP